MTTILINRWGNQIPIDTDPTMAENSDSRIASQKAIKTAIAAVVDAAAAAALAAMSTSEPHMVEESGWTQTETGDYTATVEHTKGKQFVPVHCYTVEGVKIAPRVQCTAINQITLTSPILGAIIVLVGN